MVVPSSMAHAASDFGYTMLNTVRTLAVVVIAIVSAAGFLSSCNRPKDAAGITAPQALACTARISFPEESGRLLALRDNADALINYAREGQYFFLATDERDIEVIYSAEDCSHPPVLALSRGSIGQFSQEPVQEVNARLTDALVSQHNEQHLWRCIVRVGYADDPLPVALIVEYVGLHSPQLEAANSRLFLASQDECEDAGRLLDRAIQIVSGSSQRLRQTFCVETSLRSCGYPLRITATDHSR